MLTASKLIPNIPPLFASLSKIISGDLDCSHLAIKEHSTDGSLYAVRPQAVLFPKNTADIKHAIAFSREYQIPLTVCGGLSAGSGGALGEGIVVDMTRYFSHIRHVNVLNQTVTVDTGVRIDDLIERLASWNMEIPVLQKEFSRATIGGMLATKSATPSTFYNGTIKDWVEGMTVVVDTGEEHHLSDGVTPSGRLLGIYQSVFPLLTEHGTELRNAQREMSDDSTGYSVWNTSIGPRQLMSQMIGSEGTLGIITSVTLRTVQRSLHTMSVLVPVPKASLLPVYSDIAQHHNASRLFMFDQTFKKLSDTFYPEHIHKSFPESPYALLVSMKHDDNHTLSTRMRSFIKSLPEHQEMTFDMDESVANKIMSPDYAMSLFSFYFKGMHMVSTAGVGMIVSKHSYASFLQEIDTHIAQTGRMYILSGYVGSGHISALTAFDAQSLNYDSDTQEYRERLFSIVEKYKGGISAVSGDGLERTSGLSYVFPEKALDFFKKLKQAWDPISIFNPSKKIKISKDYLMKQVVRSFS